MVIFMKDHIVYQQWRTPLPEVTTLPVLVYPPVVYPPVVYPPFVYPVPTPLPVTPPVVVYVTVLG